MGDFWADTALTPCGDGSFTRMLERDWEIWGPNGGYMAALALRAAGVHSGRARPANATVHFLGVANFDDPVVVTPTTLRDSRVATSVAVSIAQLGKPILQAMIWTLDPDLPGLEHDHAVAPNIAPWSELLSLQERFAAAGQAYEPNYRFWHNFEERSPEWIDDWDNRAAGDPSYLEWMRFVSAPPRDDPWAVAAQLLLLTDLGGWPAVCRRHIDSRYIAPTLDVSCEFHRLDSRDDWFLLQGHSPFAGEGLIGSHQHVWDTDGRLMASGVSHLLCKALR